MRAHWTVHDVVAHLALATRDTAWGLVKGAIKAFGNFDRMTADMACEQARRFEPPALIQQLRHTAPSTRRAPFSGLLDPLVDVLVHGQDIMRPLGRVHPMPPEHAVPASPTRSTAAGTAAASDSNDVALIATDINWSAGTATTKLAARESGTVRSAV